MLTDMFDSGMDLLGWFLLVLKAFALIDAAFRPDTAFRNAGKINKLFWLVVLGIGVAWDAFVPGGWLSFVGIAGLIAAIIYVVDVRPAVRDIGRGRGRSGPYGSW